MPTIRPTTPPFKIDTPIAYLKNMDARHETDNCINGWRITMTRALSLRRIEDSALYVMNWQLVLVNTAAGPVSARFVSRDHAKDKRFRKSMDRQL